MRSNKKLADPLYSPKGLFSSQIYRIDLDVSVECDENLTNYFQNLIGVLRLIVDSGRIHIDFEVSPLSKFLAPPRTGHIYQALYIFKHLEVHDENDITFNQLCHDIDSGEDIDGKINEMRQIYVNTVEDLPTNTPESRGRPIQINFFVDFDHAGDRMTRRSQTGIVIYCNSAPIYWYAKRQNTVESLPHGAEFVALKIASELVTSLRYKLRIFGIPIMGPSNVFCDNESVFKNSSFADVQLKKKHHSICYHIFRECVPARNSFP